MVTNAIETAVQRLKNDGKAVQISKGVYRFGAAEAPSSLREDERSE